MNMLLQIWKLSKAEADLRFDQLVQQGVEPQPGPAPESDAGSHAAGTDEAGEGEDDDPDPFPLHPKNQLRSTARLLSVNFRDAPGLWRFLALLQADHQLADIICLQEVCLRPSEFSTVQAKLAHLNFHSYYSLGRNGAKATGGVLVAARKSMSQKLLAKHEQDDFQHLFLQCGHWVVAASYIPPRALILEPALAALQDLLQTTQAAAGNRPWLAAGDYNATPAEIAPLFQLFGGQLVNKQTRWQNHRFIDHIWSNHPTGCTKVSSPEYKISDRKCLTTTIPVKWQNEISRCTLHKAHRWTPPPGHTNSSWMAHLTSTWDALDLTPLASAIRTASLSLQQDHIDAFWDCFNSTLHRLFQSAASTMPSPSCNSLQPTLQRWQQVATTATPKPLQPHVHWVSARPQRTPATMFLRKQSNYLARASRLLELLDLPARNTQQQAEADHLCHKLHFPAFTSTNTSDLRPALQAATNLQQTLAQEAEQQKQAKLQQCAVRRA